LYCFQETLEFFYFVYKLSAWFYQTTCCCARIIDFHVDTHDKDCNNLLTVDVLLMAQRYGMKSKMGELPMMTKSPNFIFHLSYQAFYLSLPLSGHYPFHATMVSTDKRRHLLNINFQMIQHHEFYIDFLITNIVSFHYV